MLKIRNYFIVFAVAFAISTAYAMIGIQDAKAQAADSGAAYTDLIKRIEALESKPASNVSAGKIRGLNIGFDIRHRFELRNEDFALANGGGVGAGALANSIATAAATPLISIAGNEGLAGRRVLVRNDETGAFTTGITTATPGGTGRDNETIDFTLQRVRLTFDADINKNVRAFINLQDQRVFGEEGSAFAATGTLGNLGRTDLLEGYVDLRNLGDFSPVLKDLSLRIGRWQWSYGNDRLIGNLNWTNQGRAYDGARVRWDDKKGNWVDLFAAQVEEFGAIPAGNGNTVGATATVGAPKLDEVLWGFYSHFKVLDGHIAEPYVIVRSRSAENVRFGTATADTTTGEQRYTVGARFDGSNMTGLGGLDYTIEPAWQFGKVEGLRAGDFSTRGNAVGSSFGRSESQVIQAFAIYAGGGYTFKNIPWSPRIGYAYAFASGDDDPNTGSAKTFDHLYPTGHAQLGYIDVAAWQNIKDHQIHLSFKPTKKLVIDTKAHFFELDEEADSWYGVAGGTGWGGGRQIIRTGADVVGNIGATGVFSQTGSVDDELGQEIDVTVQYNLVENFGVVAGYSHFFAGDFIEDTGNGRDQGVDWVYLMTTLKF